MCKIYSKHESEAVHGGHSCSIVQTGFKDAASVAVFWSLESLFTQRMAAKAGEINLGTHNVCQ